MYLGCGVGGVGVSPSFFLHVDHVHENDSVDSLTSHHHYLRSQAHYLYDHPHDQTDGEEQPEERRLARVEPHRDPRVSLQRAVVVVWDGRRPLCPLDDRHRTAQAPQGGSTPVRLGYDVGRPLQPLELGRPAEDDLLPRLDVQEQTRNRPQSEEEERGVDKVQPPETLRVVPLKQRKDAIQELSAS